MGDRIRVSLVFPRELWEEVRQTIPAGERSRIIAEAMAREVQKWQQLRLLEQIRDLQDEFRERYGEMPSAVKDLRALREEEKDDDAGLC